jgi:hypothetical protein
MSFSKQPLAIYLHDHLAGAASPLGLVGTMRDNFRDQELGEFAAILFAEIAADKEVLHCIGEPVGKRLGLSER